MPPTRKGRKSAAAVKAAAELDVVQKEADIEEVNDDFTEDLEGALAQEEEAIDEETNEVEEAIVAEMEGTENTVEPSVVIDDDNASDDIIIEKEVERVEEMEEVVDSEAEEETLVNELMKETQDDNIVEIEPETVHEKKVVEKEKPSNEEKEKTEEKSTKAATKKVETVSEEKKNEKESEKKFVPKKIVLNFEDDSLELKVNQDDLFEADDTPVKELLQCSICETTCARGVTTKCCNSNACRMCATKKLTADKQCWMCNEPLKTEDLINNEDLRTAVSLFKTDKEIPEELLNKLKKENKKGKSGEKERTVSPTEAEKPKTKDGSEATKPKKDTILYLEENHELPKMENGFEDETTKVYMAIQGTRFRISQQHFSVLFQVCMLNGETGKSWVFAMSPDKRIRGDKSIMDLLHVKDSNKGRDFVMDIADAKIECFRNMDSFHNNIIKFLKEAKSGSKEIELVLYSNAEHHELYRCIGKKLLPHVTTAYVYEDIDKDIKPISGEEWRSNKWVLKLRELVSKITKDKFKKKKLSEFKLLPLVKTSGVLLVSPLHTDTTAWKHFGSKAQDGNKRKSVDSSVKSDTAAKKAKVEPKAASANTASANKAKVEPKVASANTAKDTKNEDLRKKLASSKVVQSQVNKNFNNGRDNRGQVRQNNRGQSGRQDNRGQFGRQTNMGTAGRPINPWAQGQGQYDMHQSYNNMQQAPVALLGDRPSMAIREEFQRNYTTGRSDMPSRLGGGMGQRNDSGLSSELMQKQMAIQMEAQRIEKLKLELELEKIKIERARLSQMKSSIGNESKFNSSSYQSDKSGNYDQYDKSRQYDNNDKYQYGGQADSYGMQDGFQNGSRQANMSADRFPNDRKAPGMFTSGNQITRDDVKRVMNSGSLNPAAGSRFMGGAMNNTGNSGMGGAMMNRGGGDMQFASDRFAQPPAQNRFNPMMGTFSNNRNWPN